MRTIDSIVAEWKARGIRRTPRRLAVLREILGDASHPSAETLYRRLRRSGISFATVYNSLESMVRRGDIGVLRINETMRFDPNVEPHHHAVCETCGSIFDVPGKIGPRTFRAPLPRGFKSRRVSLEFRGECRCCRRKAKRHGPR